MNSKSEQLTNKCTLEFALDARLSSRETLVIVKNVFKVIALVYLF